MHLYPKCSLATPRTVLGYLEYTSSLLPLRSPHTSTWPNSAGHRSVTETILSWIVHYGQEETSVSLAWANSEWVIQAQHNSFLLDPPQKQLIRPSPTSTFPKDHPHSALVASSVGQARVFYWSQLLESVFWTMLLSLGLETWRGWKRLTGGKWRFLFMSSICLRHPIAMQ